LKSHTGVVRLTIILYPLFCDSVVDQ